MVKIGVINIDTSHPQGFTDYLIKGNRARYTAIYNDGFRGNDEVEGFIEKYGLEKRCYCINDLVDCVDIGFIQGCNWDTHINYVMPFINKKKPIFIDKPLVGKLKDCLVLEKLADEGAVILGSSSLRYSEEITHFKETSIVERGEILNVIGTVGVDEFNYGVHIVEGIGGLIGPGAVSCKFIGRSKLDCKTCETFLIRYESGVTALYNIFHGHWQPFNFIVMTTKTTYSFSVDTNKIYWALLDLICDYMETGTNKFAPVTELTESIKIMLAGKISRKKGGIDVKISDIPLDDPGYNGKVFECNYAATASKIYL